jgi:hypothetical protein
MPDTYIRDSDQPGLAVSQRDSGSKSYVVFVTRPGRKGSHRVTIGPVKKFSIAEACKQALHHHRRRQRRDCEAPRGQGGRQAGGQ